MLYRSKWGIFLSVEKLIFVKEEAEIILKKKARRPLETGVLEDNWWNTAWLKPLIINLQRIQYLVLQHPLRKCVSVTWYLSATVHMGWYPDIAIHVFFKAKKNPFWLCTQRSYMKKDIDFHSVTLLLSSLDLRCIRTCVSRKLQCLNQDFKWQRTYWGKMFQWLITLCSLWYIGQNYSAQETY